MSAKSPKITNRSRTIQCALDILLAHNLISQTHIENDMYYTWTDMGKIACPRYADPWPGYPKSPIEWATAMANNTERHCIVCGRDCFRKWVGADNNKQCICTSCYRNYKMDDNGDAVLR